MVLTNPSKYQQSEYNMQKSMAAPKSGLSNGHDLAALLYAGCSDTGLEHDDDHHFIVNQLEHPTPLSYPSTGRHTPVFDHDDEEAVLSDIPSESESELEIPPSPPTPKRRHRNATSFSDHVEFPIFLGRQSERASAPTLRPVLKKANPLSQTTKRGNHSVRILMPEEHVDSLSGPLMSLWPVPIELAQYDWSEEDTTATSRAIPVEQHVFEMEGPLMSWWPAPADLL